MGLKSDVINWKTYEIAFVRTHGNGIKEIADFAGVLLFTVCSAYLERKEFGSNPYQLRYC